MLGPDRAARLTVWGNAVLLGHAAPDDAATAICGGDAVHRVEALDGEPVALSLTFGDWRRSSVRGLRLSLPAPGDPVGLPASLVAASVDAGGAVVVARDGVSSVYLAEGAGRGVLWRRHDRAPSVPVPVGSLAESERELREAIRLAAAALVDLDVEPSAEAGELLGTIRTVPDDGLAPGYPGRAQRVAAQARRLRAVVAVALDDGAGRRALLQVDRAARYAEMAACNAILEPQPDGAR